MSAEAASTSIAVFNKNLSLMVPEFRKALPPHVHPDKFARVCATAIATKPELLNADRRTLFGAMTKAAQDGLLPDGREAALVVFGKEVQYMPMVAGIMKKVRNSGDIGNWSVHVVCENDEFDYQLGDEEKIIHKPARKDRGIVIGAYSIVSLKGEAGEKSREYMDVAEIEAVRSRSRSAEKGPWKTDYAEMCKKTVIRRHSKRLPMSTDLDEFIRREDELTELEPIATIATQEPVTRPTRLAAIATTKGTAAKPPETSHQQEPPMFDDDSPPPDADDGGLL